MKIKRKYPCPVCGFQMSRPPANFSICPSCGTEFGYQDSGTTHDVLRDEWIRSGTQWHSRVEKRPKDWNPYVQLLKAGFVSIEIAVVSSADYNSESPRKKGVDIEWRSRPLLYGQIVSARGA